MSDQERRIENLEREIVRLRSELSAGGVAPLPKTTRSLEPRVTITYPQDRNRSFSIPSGDELRRLHKIVIARYPQLATRSEQPDDALEGFGRAFHRIGHLGRDKLNDQYTLMSWVDDATFWMRDHQIYPSTLTGNDFICAVLAHGDVDYVPLGRFPVDCSAFGLRRDSSGRPAADGWRAVLSMGRLREPVPLAVGWGQRA